MEPTQTLKPLPNLQGWAFTSALAGFNFAMLAIIMGLEVRRRLEEGE